MYTTVDRDYKVNIHEDFDALMEYLKSYHFFDRFEKDYYLLGQESCNFGDFLFFKLQNMSVVHIFSVNYCEWVIQVQRHKEKI